MEQFQLTFHIKLLQFSHMYVVNIGDS